MQFNKVIGQHAIKQHLIHSVQTQQISHAQLFIGKEGSGQLALALAYAQYVNCKNPQNNDSCGQCSPCIKSQKMIHPDIHYCYPTVGSKAKSTDFVAQWRTAILANPYLNVFQWVQQLEAGNKQGNITAQECEDIVRKLSFTAYEGGYKMLIMWMPEYLGKEGNRLLKLIEEPPEKTLFLLVAENPDLILNTILSRTQQLKVNRLTDEEISSALQQKRQLSTHLAQQIGVLAEGNYNAALHLLANHQNDNQDLLVRWLSACLHQQISDVNSWVEEVARLGREQQKNFIQYTLHFLRQSILVQVLPQQLITLNKSERLLAKEINAQLSIEAFTTFSDWLNKAAYAVERNANPKVLLFSLSIQVMDLVKR